MELKYEQKGSALKVVLPSEIDHHSAKTVREETDVWIGKLQPKTVVLDFSKVTFMDSSGIGLIIGRYKRTVTFGGRVVVECANERIENLLRMAGMDKLVEIHVSVMR